MQILIEDSGPGIPLADRQRVLEPFFSTKENGVGLGLAVSYAILTAHGGSMQIVDGRDKGACFRLVFPKTDPRQEENDEIEKCFYVTLLS